MVSKEMAEKVKAIEDAFIDAERYAAENNERFSVQIPDGMYITYVPEDGIRPTVMEYWDGCVDEETMPKEWDGEYAGWQNSSTFC